MTNSETANTIATTIRLAAMIAAVLGLACYNPTVGPNLMCAPTGKKCPDGFECSRNLCFKIGTAPPATGGTTGSGGTTGTGGRGTGGSGSGGAVGPVRTAGQPCDVMNQGLPTQSDNCDKTMGLTCFGDCSTGQHCFKTCTSEADCPQSQCTRTPPAGTPIMCESPFVVCNPMTHAGCGAGLSCYLLASEAASSGGSRTVCEPCAGAAANGESCLSSQECFRGLVCPVVGALGGGFCRKACDPDALVSGCVSLCSRYGARWGYCFP